MRPFYDLYSNLLRNLRQFINVPISKKEKETQNKNVKSGIVFSNHNVKELLNFVSDTIYDLIKTSVPKMAKLKTFLMP